LVGDLLGTFSEVLTLVGDLLWTFFQQLAPSYRRHFVVWIDIVKPPEPRQKRIRESIALLAAEKKLGLK